MNMLCEKLTVPGGTMTSEGLINHLWNPAGFAMPVKIVVDHSSVKKLLQPQVPVRDDAGNLLFALPNGGEYVQVSEKD